MGEIAPYNLRFESQGHQIQFAQNNQVHLVVTDGHPELLTAQDWNKRLRDQFARETVTLAERIHSQEAMQEEVAEDHRGIFTDHSIVSATSDWSGGVSFPTHQKWQEAWAALRQITTYRERGDWLQAYQALQQTKNRETLARKNWETYLQATMTGAEDNNLFQREMAKDVVVAGSAGVGAVVVAPVVATWVAGAAIAAGASATVGTMMGAGSAVAVGGAAAGTTGNVVAKLIQAVRQNQSTGSAPDVAFIQEVTRQSALSGAVASLLPGLSSAASATTSIVAESVATGTSLSEVALQKTIFPASQAWSGTTAQLGNMWAQVKASFVSPAYWMRVTKLGGASAGIRAGYDLLDARVTGKEKTLSEMSHNAGVAFLGGGFCGGIAQGWKAFHFIGLDVFGDFSQHALTDIREKYGNEKGLALSGAALAAENVAAATAFVPILGSWSKAAKTVLWGDAISIGLEAWLQHSSGKDWADLDTGRFVGMSMWGHAAVFLPETILGNAPAAMDIATKAARTAELGVKYLLFANPSLANFSARVNHQNWGNVLAGDTSRQATVMWIAKGWQAVRGPSSPDSMLVDEALGLWSIGEVNKPWPRYEGVPEMWSKGLTERISALKDAGGGHPSSYEMLTQYLSEEMGKLSLIDPAGEYLPSPINLKQASALLNNKTFDAELALFGQYLQHLAAKGKRRSPQEEMIYQNFAVQDPVFPIAHDIEIASR